jgi:hypothetical protein
MLSSLVLSTTYKCPAKCRYCGAQCGPENEEQLSRQDMLDIIDQVYAFGQLRLVVFTGGEPFLLGDDLLHCVAYCAGKGLATRIVTNAYWAVTPESARSRIQQCKEAGLSEINLSCDDYHQEFIPLERIKYANAACLELGLPCLLGHKVLKDHEISIEYLEEYLGCKLARFDPKKKNPDNNVISTGFNVPVEEDMHLIPDAEILYPDSDSQWKEPCASILQRVVITPRKELSICCGMVPRKVEEMFFGTLAVRTLEELIVEAHQDLIVNWLAFEGPYGLMKFIQSKDPSISFRPKYVNNCHLCSEILTREDCRRVLTEYGSEKLLEIALERNLYDYLRTAPKSFTDRLLPDCAELGADGMQVVHGAHGVAAEQTLPPR